jgi:dihydropteroate synthase
MAAFPILVGIINITEDSFSDGGLYLDPDKAIALAQHLWKSGADVLELGPASSNPDAKPVSPEIQIARLDPVIAALASMGKLLAVDSTAPEVQRYAVKCGVDILNDIGGFPDPTQYDWLASAPQAKLVVMHSIASGPRAIRVERTVREVSASIDRFFDQRLSALTKAGITSDRLIVDPGMGFFLASNPEPSLSVLASIKSLHAKFGLPVMVSVSRKSFLRRITGTDGCDIAARTLAAELYAWMQGVDYIRTHDVGLLREAMSTMAAVKAAEILPMQDK